jgi:hypothetical protein
MPPRQALPGHCSGVPAGAGELLGTSTWNQPASPIKHADM